MTARARAAVVLPGLLLALTASACSDDAPSSQAPASLPSATTTSTTAGTSAPATSSAEPTTTGPAGPTGSASAAASPSATPTASGSASPSAAATSPGTAASTGAPTPGGRCTSASLSASLDEGQGAAGTSYQDLRLTNTSRTSCTVQGFPGVSFVSGEDGEQVGDPADRQGGSATPSVLLEPGRSATAQLGVVNSGALDAGSCRPAPTRGVRVYPPGERAALFAPFPDGDREVCSAPGKTGASIQALQRG